MILWVVVVLEVLDRLVQVSCSTYGDFSFCSISNSADGVIFFLIRSICIWKNTVKVGYLHVSCVLEVFGTLFHVVFLFVFIENVHVYFHLRVMPFCRTGRPSVTVLSRIIAHCKLTRGSFDHRKTKVGWLDCSSKSACLIFSCSNFWTPCLGLNEDTVFNWFKALTDFSGDGHVCSKKPTFKRRPVFQNQRGHLQLELKPATSKIEVILGEVLAQSSHVC